MGSSRVWGSPDDVRATREVLQEGAQRAGRDLAVEGFRTILFHNVYVLRPGERADSVEARMALGPSICAALAT